VDDRVNRELFSHDRGPSKDCPFCGPQAVEARRQQGVDRGRDGELGFLAAVFPEHGDELFDEQRIAAGRLQHAELGHLRQPGGELYDQRIALSSREPL